MNAVRRGFVRVESTQGVFPVAIPFTSQGLYSTVADATGTIGGDRDPWVETHGKIHLPLRGKNSVG
jgi:hypothetical protein